jgi:hypothetical protein
MYESCFFPCVLSAFCTPSGVAGHGYPNKCFSLANADSVMPSADAVYACVIRLSNQMMHVPLLCIGMLTRTGARA